MGSKVGCVGVAFCRDRRTLAMRHDVYNCMLCCSETSVMVDNDQVGGQTFGAKSDSP